MSSLLFLIPLGDFLCRSLRVRVNRRRLHGKGYASNRAGRQHRKCVGQRGASSGAQVLAGGGYYDTIKAVRCRFCRNKMILEFQTKSMPCGFVCRSLAAGLSAAKIRVRAPRMSLASETRITLLKCKCSHHHLPLHAPLAAEHPQIARDLFRRPGRLLRIIRELYRRPAVGGRDLADQRDGAQSVVWL